MKKLILAFVIMALQITCYGQHPKVRNFDKDTYKGGNQIWQIAQDKAGNMIFANTGILSYDGTEWTLTQTDNRTTVRSLLYDHESERLYYGAANEFGYTCIDEENRKSHKALTEGINITMEDIWAIHKIGSDLWLRENTNIYCYDFQSIKQYSFQDKVSCSAVMGQKLLIFVNNHGVFSLEDDGHFTALPGTESLKEKRVVSIIPYEENIVFVCSNGEIYLYDDKQMSIFNNSFKKETEQATIYCADSNGRYLALGTVTDGVYILDLSTGRKMHLNTYSGLQNNTVLSMFFDLEGNLWLGLDKGIDLILLSSSVYSLFGNSDAFGTGYASEIYDGRLWLGTNQGLYCAPMHENGSIPDDRMFTSIREAKGQVWSLMAYDGRLFCCHDRGIYIIKGKRCQHIPMNGAWKLEKLREWPGYLLGSSYDRLFLLKSDGGNWIFDSWITGFDDATKAFEEDYDGTIWFSHWIKGLFKLKLDMESKSITESLFMSRNNGFPEDWSNIPLEVNNKIIFTTARGIYGYDRYSGKAFPLEIINSMFENPPQGASVFFSPYGYTYFSSSSLQAISYKDQEGRTIVDSLSLKSLTAKRLQGFEDIRCLSEKHILVNTNEGFSLVDMDMLKEGTHRKTPQVYIKEIQTNNEEIVYASFGSHPVNENGLQIPFKSNTLEVKAGYPEFETINGIRFSFFLENYDKNWSQYSESNKKEYTKLPHGRYVLKVRAMDNIHSQASETSMEIHIMTPWYYSTTAILVYMLLGGLFIFMTYEIMYRFSIKKARLLAMKKEEELKQKQIKQELDHKAHDLAASTMNVIRKNEILLDIDTELEEVAESIAEDRNKSLKLLAKIRQQIKENIQHDDIWQKFEENFNIVYDDFLKRLGTKYPHLTISDKKMCAYLKMDLSSKEIAPLLNLTVRSVEMTRYRLRKKLGLNREDNLTEFLQNF